ncbi:hypothetical protein JHK82_032417 [Glycine max]|nr:hypothetical protein JHK82_032417 [Glycine max]
MSSTTPPLKPDQCDPVPGTPSSPAGRGKLQKIPPIPIRRSKVSSSSTTTHAGNVDEGQEEDSSSILLASSLGLNHIRTRSSSFPLRYSSSLGAPSFLTQDAVTVNDARLRSKSNNSHPRKVLGPHSSLLIRFSNVKTKTQLFLYLASVLFSFPNEMVSDYFVLALLGGKVHLGKSKTLRPHSQLIPGLEGHHAAFTKEMQSPRFQEILRLTSGRKKRNPDIKSFSHELNSKGVRPFPIWKHRAFGHMEEVMAAIRFKFEKLKEEVDSDLGGFAGDLVGILEKNLVSDREWKERLEDLLVVTQQCAKMTPTQFWIKCESIVQNLDDKRQELPVGILKQTHTRLLFILTRCTRLVQFQKESGYEQDHILGLHQFSDLGVYPEQIFKAVQQKSSIPSAGHEMPEKQLKMSHGKEKDKPITEQSQADQHVSVAIDNGEVATAKSIESTPGTYKMSSWRKLPSAGEKKRKDQDAVDFPSKGELDHLLVKDENCENLDTLSCHPEHSQSSSRARKVSWGFWGDQQNLTYEDSMICRICEVEIPIVHVEEHSRICTIADRCDLKGLTVNERLERVSETIERILESWTPKSTPKSTDTSGESFELAAVSTSSVHEEFNDLSLERNNLTCRCSEDMLDSGVEPDNTFAMEDLNLSSGISCEAHICLKTDHGTKLSSAGSLTPRSPLITPRTTQIEILLSGRRTLSELESCDQISKLVEIARAVANVNNCDYRALEYMLDRLEDLKYAIQDRKVDALIVETFGRRIEKLLQEKYLSLCGQIEDEKVDSSTSMADEESSVEDDTVRSLRASPINACSKDRTSIEDFEIIKPISRGAFGRVFLARKRATGDLFAIKVLKKADMIRKNAVQSILAERDILISVRNPFVVRFFYSFTCRENLYLVMEYLNGGDLYSILRNLGCLDEDMARVYIAEVVLALEYLHSLNVIHRDLKPDNLLIGQDGHIKLTDFGLSKVGLINSTDDLSAPSFSDNGFLGDDEPKSRHSSKREERQKQSVVGTPDYLAPEILLGMGHGATADWWSVGVILYELLVGIPPFNAEHPQQIFDNIINRDIQWPKIPEEISFEAYDLINNVFSFRLLNENPVQRLGATGATEVKRHAFFKDINWDTLARQKAMFIPMAEALDTSYFMSRYIWNPEDEHCLGGSDFDEITETCSSGSGSDLLDEDGDECGSLAEFSGPPLEVQYSFSNFSFKEPPNHNNASLSQTFTPGFSFHTLSHFQEKDGICPKPLITFVLGGPGSGKGTQCAKIVETFGFKHLSAGDLLRREMVSDSEYGEGKIVPSGVTVKLILREMESSDNHKFLIDGFPRSQENRIAFEQIIGAEPDMVLFFDCPEEEMVKRVLSRNQGRIDDNIDTIKNRLKVFESLNLPVIDYYAKKGKLYRINAVGTVDEIFEHVRPVFEACELVSRSNGRVGKPFRPHGKPSLNKLAKTCYRSHAVRHGIRVHRLIPTSLLHKNFGISSKLLRLYASCGYLDDAHDLFDQMAKRDTSAFPWNSLISGYAQVGHYDDAIALYFQMVEEGVDPDLFTFPRILKVCARIGSVQVGEEVHRHAVRAGFATDGFVLNARVERSLIRCLIETPPHRDPVPWNSMLTAYVHHGLEVEAMKIFRQMILWVIRRGHERNLSIGNSLIMMYSNNGLIKKAYSIIVDGMGSEAAGPTLWGALLYACFMHGDATIGEIAANRLFDLEPDNEHNFVLLMRIYENAGRLEDMERVRMMLVDRGLDY